jgi:hypothetical protein
MRIVLMMREVPRVLHQIGRDDWADEYSGRDDMIFGVRCRGCPGYDCGERQYGSNPKRDDLTHLMVPSETWGCSPSAAPRPTGVRLRGLLNGRVCDTFAARAIFFCSHRACYPVDRCLPSYLVRLTAGAHEHVLSSNQPIDALSGLRGKSSRTFDFGSEPLESSDLLGVSVGRNKDECGKSNCERCGIAPARQRRMEVAGDARGLGPELGPALGTASPFPVKIPMGVSSCSRRRSLADVADVAPSLAVAE